MKRRETLLRVVCASVLAMLALASATLAARPEAKDHKPFAALSARLSEPGGYFDSDNLISNETSYLHILGQLKELGVSGGVYLGVGPDQNFTYIAKIKPKLALMIDIRRDNLLQHLMFKALFERAHNRVEYLCALFGKPNPKTGGWDLKSVSELITYVDAAAPDQALFEQTIKNVKEDVQKYGITLTDMDLQTIAKIQRAFYADGLDIRYSSLNRPSRQNFPTYRDLLLQTDLAGRQSNYLNSEEDFQFLKQMEEHDLIVPVTGDLAGTQAMKNIGQYMKEIKEKVSAFYVSNVEFYLERQGTFGNFCANVKGIPFDGHSVIIRSYFNRYWMPPDMQPQPNHMSVQSIEKIEDLVKRCSPGT